MSAILRKMKIFKYYTMDERDSNVRNLDERHKDTGDLDERDKDAWDLDEREKNNLFGMEDEK